jgi:hypothetical protein
LKSFWIGTHFINSNNMLSPFRLYLIILSIILSVSACQPEIEITYLEADSPLIRYTGRINDRNPKAPVIYWPGSEMEVNFMGDSLKIILDDERGKNYFNIVMDEDSLRYIQMDSGRHTYLLAAGLTDQFHKIELIKRTEWDLGNTVINGVELVNGKLSEPDPGNGRVIEFFGNSITAGYAIEDDTGKDSPDSIYTNHYNTYGAITARHFKADYIGTVKSGIGIMISWFPEIMTEIYDRLDPADSASHWEFSRITPDVVVINLFQNDSWLIEMPEHPSFKQRFRDSPPDEEFIISAYIDFVSSIRDKYPEAMIICALGSMDATREGSPWPVYVTEAVKRMKDKNIETLFFPYIQKGGHPRVEDNRKMAEKLIALIEEKTGWYP